jgi:uncharacterized membrane protein
VQLKDLRAAGVRVGLALLGATMLAFNAVGIDHIVVILAIAVLVIFVLFQLAIFLRLPRC